MKTTFLTLLLASSSLFAQGTVNFGNATTLSTTHVWGSTGIVSSPFLRGYGSNDTPSGTVPFAADGNILIGANGTGGLWGAATTFAQLLAAPGSNMPESSLTPMGQTVTFRTGAAAGRTITITDTLQGIAPDAPAATFEMVAWDNSSGLYSTWNLGSVAWNFGLIMAGSSGTFNVFNIGGSANTPPNLPIPSFNITGVPEPSTAALAGLAALTLLAFRRGRG
jgi:hypothetical protein